MLSVIIYATDPKYLDKTIDGIIDRTPHLKEIIVCDDAALAYSRPGVKILTTDRIGRVAAWNAAADIAHGDILIFIKDKTKVSDDWSVPLQAALTQHPQSLVSPVVHTLDLGLWMTEASRWRRFGWRWDMNIYDRTYVGRPESPAISANCIAVTKSWFKELGAFDTGIVSGGGDDIELSLRCWLLGGSVLVCDDSIIAAALEVDYNHNTVNNLARVMEAWLPNQVSYFYAARDLSPAQVTVGRLTNLTKLQARQKRQAEWFLATQQPELLSLYNLRGSAAGKSVAVVGPGPSLDLINEAMIQRHDIIIGVDYVGMLFDCDFVFADSTQVIAELKQKYNDNKFVTPIAIQDRPSGSWVAAAAVVPLAQQYELAQAGAVPVALEPPLCNFDNQALAAIHFALFLNPAAVTVFGCDHKIIGGKSHTAKIDYYDGGRLWPDSESTRQRFALFEYGLDQLGRLAYAAGIPLLRTGHA